MTSESAWANIRFFLYQLDPDIRQVRRFEHLKKENLRYSTKHTYICGQGECVSVLCVYDDIKRQTGKLG